MLLKTYSTVILKVRIVNAIVYLLYFKIFSSMFACERG